MPTALVLIFLVRPMAYLFKVGGATGSLAIPRPGYAHYNVYGDLFLTFEES